MAKTPPVERTRPPSVLTTWRPTSRLVEIRAVRDVIREVRDPVQEGQERRSDHIRRHSEEDPHLMGDVDSNEPGCLSAEEDITPFKIEPKTFLAMIEPKQLLRLRRGDFLGIFSTRQPGPDLLFGDRPLPEIDKGPLKKELTESGEPHDPNVVVTPTGRILELFPEDLPEDPESDKDPNKKDKK